MKCPVCDTNAVTHPTQICMGCVMARAKTATTGGRCRCPKTLKNPRTVTTRSRSWVACDRCLGTIKQLT